LTLQIPVMRALIVLTLISAGLAGCSHLPSMPKLSMPSLSPYKIDIQQGNVVDQATLAKLQLGMTRAQVKFVMGTPLLTDIFHANRWDYIYIYRKDGKITEQHRAVLYFDGDKLDRIVDLLDDGKGAPPAAIDKTNAPAAADMTGAPAAANKAEAPAAVPATAPIDKGVAQ
jgi:outer membrane protein assembly factor BamE